jgi:hypothetical protein
MPAQQQWNQTQRCPKDPPGVARAFACEGSCRFMRCRAGRRPIGRAMGVCRTGCALCLVRVAHAAAPSFSPGAARSGIARGPVPHQTRDPRPRPYPPLRGPVHGSCPGPGAGKHRPGQVRRTTQRWWRLLWSQRAASPREVPSICGVTVGGGAGRSVRKGVAPDRDEAADAVSDALDELPR